MEKTLGIYIDSKKNKNVLVVEESMDISFYNVPESTAYICKKKYPNLSEEEYLKFLENTITDYD